MQELLGETERPRGVFAFLLKSLQWLLRKLVPACSAVQDEIRRALGTSSLQPPLHSRAMPCTSSPVQFDTPFPRPCTLGPQPELEPPRAWLPAALSAASTYRAPRGAWPTARAATAAARLVWTSASSCSTPTRLSRCCQVARSFCTLVRMQRARWPVRLRCASGACALQRPATECASRRGLTPRGRVSRIAPAQASAARWHAPG